MHSNIRIVRPTGILDGTRTNQFRNEISTIVNAGARVILVDLEDVTFMDSSGLGALVLALKNVHSAGGKLCVCSINDQIKILFELTRMDQVFEIFSNQDEFAQKLNSV
jgi:anti-sigma B factor antagonist